ncbi:CheR family methyltransferase [Steroidobacter denitrificans]|uniref:CheR family methyltransferase n=1 Tax=Steroidobacter denitrificans TaxID=465721 RepID=UPI000AB9E5A7|nr:protein-glutamate O-methyltransferase CheR [Steroidobacter denitrificans]
MTSIVDRCATTLDDAVDPHPIVHGPVLGDAEFEFIRHVIGENAGIVLGPNKRQLVQGRLGRRLRELGLSSYAAYCDHVRESGPEELVRLINALTTNVTAFFRENHHFEALASYMLPEAMQRNAASRRIRLWSAGCSTGEEPYCLAMTAIEAIGSSARWDLKILATDIDSNVVASAQGGIYPVERLEAVPQGRLSRFFHKGRNEQTGRAMLKREVRDRVTFRTLNLLHNWPMRGPFDVIFCRNVMIYFDQPTRERLVRRFAELLVPGGYLCIGHSESIHHGTAPLRLVGKTIYRRNTGDSHD